MILFNLNKDNIKLIAMFTMLLNHLATIYMEPGTIIYELFIDIGYFTAITMCYFLVEGYTFTSSKKKYCTRLLLFAIISEIPYYLALNKVNGNMFFTLFLCFLIIWIEDNKKIKKHYRIACLFIIMIISCLCDWGLLAPTFTLLFIWAKDSINKKKCAFLLSAALFGSMNFIAGIEEYEILWNVIRSMGSISGIILSALFILYLYNRKRSRKWKKTLKWFFYIFYPLHLLILGLIRINYFS